ncbi:TetR/AcrR family transcriptional regulator [Streptomyces sp. NPDC056930]|uniref:TetR/AcrR family transcriptional regulator n=1 Tax=Streptomyces sp. NPDC056930 TaxID=3345967 RepID=UPI00362F8840
MKRRSRAEMLDRTREQLIAAARDYFGTRGYAATSMDDLTASVGLTRGALYHHFGGKSGLLEAVVRVLDDELCTQLKAVIRRHDDPLVALAERSCAYIELTQAPEFQRILFTDAPAVLPDAVEASTASCIRSMAEILADCQDRGAIPSAASPEALATMLNGALSDASRWVAAASPAKRNARLDVAKQSSTTLVAGLRAPS